MRAMGEERAMNPAAPDGELDLTYRTRDNFGTRTDRILGICLYPHRFFCSLCAVYEVGSRRIG